MKQKPEENKRQRTALYAPQQAMQERQPILMSSGIQPTTKSGRNTRASITNVTQRKKNTEEERGTKINQSNQTDETDTGRSIAMGQLPKNKNKTGAGPIPDLRIYRRKKSNKNKTSKIAKQYKIAHVVVVHLTLLTDPPRFQLWPQVRRGQIKPKRERTRSEK